MAWADDLLEASFRGVVFDCLSTSDSVERALAEHGYPYRDGADVEDMGRGPRRVSVEAIFFGDAYEAALKRFLAVLDEAGAGELVHPVFGAMPQMQAARWQARHSADPDQALVSVEFIESTPGNPFFERSLASQQAQRIPGLGDAALESLSGTLSDVIEDLRAINPLAALDALRQSMTAPLLAGLAEVQGLLTSGLDVLMFPRAWANDLSSIINGVLDLRDWGDDVLADWAATGAVLALFDLFADRQPVGDTAPVPPVPGSVPTQAQAVDVAVTYVAVAQAAGYAQAVERLLVAQADTPTLSPPQIEAVANAARERVQSAIDVVRAKLSIEAGRGVTEPLKDQALAIQRAAQAVIEARPPLVSREMRSPGNLRLIAHRLYGDHTRAPQLWRLNLGNGLRRPNEIQAGDRLNAYAR